MSIPRRHAAASLLTLISSAAFIASFPPYQWAVLPWLALAPLFLAIEIAATTRGAVLVAALWGMVSAYGVTSWLPPAITTYWEQPFLFGLAIFVCASALMGCLQYALFALCLRRTASARPMSPLFTAAAWVSAEYARCNFLGGNPWGLLGYTLAVPSTAAEAWASSILRLPLQVADLGGVYAVSFVLAAANAGVARGISEHWLAAAEEGQTPRPAVRPLLLAVGVVAAGLGYGAWRLPQVRPAAGEHEIPVAIVQGNISLGTTWRSDLHEANFGKYLKGTAEALRSSPSLVVWPENAMTFFPEDEPLFRKALARVLESRPVQVLAGSPSHTTGPEPSYYNSALLFGPSGQVIARYDKQKLLPFAEYFPFHSVAFLRRSFGKVREFAPGIDSGPMRTLAGKAGILICNELLYEELARARARHGAGFLLNLSNDTWIGDPVYSLNHLAVGIVRAVETRRPLIRASTSGPSAIVDATGAVNAASSPDSMTVLTGNIAPRSLPTVFVECGWMFPLGCVAWVLLRSLSRTRRN